MADLRSLLGSVLPGLLQGGAAYYLGNQNAQNLGDAAAASVRYPVNINSAIGDTRYDPNSRTFNIGYNPPSAYGGADPNLINSLGQVTNTDAEAANRLAYLRQVSAPDEMRTTNRSLDNLFRLGQLGGTSGAVQQEALAKALLDADLKRTMTAQDWAQQRASTRFQSALQTVGSGQQQQQLDTMRFGTQAQAASQAASEPDPRLLAAQAGAKDQLNQGLFGGLRELLEGVGLGDLLGGLGSGAGGAVPAVRPGTAPATPGSAVGNLGLLPGFAEAVEAGAMAPVVTPESIAAAVGQPLIPDLSAGLAGAGSGVAGLGLLPGFGAAMESAALAPVGAGALEGLGLASGVEAAITGAGAGAGAGAAPMIEGVTMTAARPGLSTLGTVGAGLGLAAGLYGAYEGISQGNEGMAALGGGVAGVSGGLLAGLSGLAALGPVGLAGAGIAALASSLTNTKEYGDKAFANYWSGVESGRGIGEAPSDELAQGFINLYRTNKWNFPGQAVYGRTGNEDFLYDMTQQINAAVNEGRVPSDSTPGMIYENVVKPWLAGMGGGTDDPRLNAVQDFMMTDIVNNYMTGKPISNAQLRNDSGYRIVSERPVYPGSTGAVATPWSDPSLTDLNVYGQDTDWINFWGFNP